MIGFVSDARMDSPMDGPASVEVTVVSTGDPGDLSLLCDSPGGEVAIIPRAELERLRAATAPGQIEVTRIGDTERRFIPPGNTITTLQVAGGVLNWGATEPRYGEFYEAEPGPDYLGLSLCMAISAFATMMILRWGTLGLWADVSRLWG